MEYWVAMNEEEVKLSLALLDRREISGVVEIGPEYTPEAAVAKDMFRKQFFQRDEEGSTWNPFVRMVLTCVTDAQSELRIESPSDFVCGLYFHNETIILLARDKEKELLVFYYVPLIPEAVGSLAKSLESLQDEMVLEGAGIDVSAPLHSNEGMKNSLTDYLSENKDHFTSGDMEVRLVINGWRNRERALAKALVQTQEGFCLATQEDDSVRIVSVDYYQLMQDLAKWIIYAHGRSLESAGRDDGEY